MLRLLLDEHISRKVASGLRKVHGNLIVHALAEWKGGELLGLNDASCLREADTHGFTFVTYDRRTIPPLLKAWAEEGRSHAGVIFVDEKSIPPSEIGMLVRSLLVLWDQTREWNWTDRVCFLQR